jgi:hypothetical protein
VYRRDIISAVIADRLVHATIYGSGKAGSTSSVPAIVGMSNRGTGALHVLSWTVGGRPVTSDNKESR